MTRQAIETSQAPAALGPYSQAIVAGGLVFCSGTAGIDPVTGPPPTASRPRPSRRCATSRPCSRPPARLAHLVKTTIFYADVDDFARLNEVYARHMPDPPPARSAPANVRLPRGLLVSIEAIAVLPTG